MNNRIYNRVIDEAKYIIINDNKYPVYEKDEAEAGDFWYC